MAKQKYKVRSKVIQYLGMDAWFFVYVDTKLADIIREKHGKAKRGFGSIKVAVTIGKTSWNTSIFPDKRSGTYLLPLKAQVRRAEEIAPDDTVEFNLAI